MHGEFDIYLQYEYYYSGIRRNGWPLTKEDNQRCHSYSVKILWGKLCMMCWYQLRQNIFQEHTSDIPLHL